MALRLICCLVALAGGVAASARAQGPGAGDAAADAPTAAPGDAAGDPEAYLAVDAARRDAGLAPLTRDPRLEAAALVHAEDMATHGYLGHVSPRTGDPASRARSAGLEPEALAQNVMRAGDAARAHEALVASEANRAHMLSDRFTHVGIAEAAGEAGETYLVQLFARLPAAAAAAPTASAPLPGAEPDAAPPATAPAPVVPRAPAAYAGPAPATAATTPKRRTPPPGARPAPPPPGLATPSRPAAAPAPAATPPRPPPPTWTPPVTQPPARPDDPARVTAVPTPHGYWLWWEGRWVWVSRGTATAGRPRRPHHRRPPTVIRVR